MTASTHSNVPPGERPCPICGQAMLVKTEQGVSIDVCPDHGVWLDRDELMAIIAEVRADAHSKSKRAAEKATADVVEKAKADEKMKHLIFGSAAYFMK